MKTKHKITTTAKNIFLNKIFAIAISSFIAGAGITYGGVMLYKHNINHETQYMQDTNLPRHEYKKHNTQGNINQFGMHENLAKTINNMPKQNLTQQEISDILHMREEEKLARDVYKALYDKWSIQAFQNISNAEQRHMDEVKILIDKYNLNDPVKNDSQGKFSDAKLQDLYTKLVKQGSKSEIEALKIGATIEDLDIYDLDVALEKTDNEDIKTIYTNLRNGSYHHMQAFIRLLKNQGKTYTPQYIDQDEFDKIISGELGSRPQARRHRQGSGSRGQKQIWD